MIWWIEQIDWMIFVYWEWWISIEATKICYFGLALSGIGSQSTRLSDVLNLKNLKTIWGIKLIFCFHWSYKNMLFWVMLQNTLGQSVCKIFYPYFDLLKLVSTISNQIFISHQMIVLQKLWKMPFISSKNPFSFSRYSNFCISIFPSFFSCQPLL